MTGWGLLLGAPVPTQAGLSPAGSIQLRGRNMRATLLPPTCVVVDRRATPVRGTDERPEHGRGARNRDPLETVIAGSC